MNYKNILQELNNTNNTDTQQGIIYYYTTSDDSYGSFNLRKITSMARGRPIHTSTIADFDGHLMSDQYNEEYCFA